MVRVILNKITTTPDETMENANKPKANARKGWFDRAQDIWGTVTPFWMFRDAGSGTVEQRSANYRFNRSRRKILPLYIVQWIGIAASLMLTTQLFSDLMQYTAPQPLYHLCATLLCMSTGIGFACSCVVIAVLSVSYLYLTHISN
jgi:hypothetical protein